jgi:hypothetical protein
MFRELLAWDVPPSWVAALQVLGMISQQRSVLLATVAALFAMNKEIAWETVTLSARTALEMTNTAFPVLLENTWWVEHMLPMEMLLLQQVTATTLLTMDNKLVLTVVIFWWDSIWIEQLATATNASLDVTIASIQLLASNALTATICRLTTRQNWTSLQPLLLQLLLQQLLLLKWWQLKMLPQQLGLDLLHLQVQE